MCSLCNFWWYHDRVWKAPNVQELLTLLSFCFKTWIKFQQLWRHDVVYHFDAIANDFWHVTILHSDKTLYWCHSTLWNHKWFILLSPLASVSINTWMQRFGFDRCRFSLRILVRFFFKPDGRWDLLRILNAFVCSLVNLWCWRRSSGAQT